MKYLNLDQQFSPFGKSISFESFVFNGGEPHIKISEALSANDEVTITTRVRSFNDIGKLLIATDALRRMEVERIHVVIPYFPGARQDRVMVRGEALSVKVYADIINAQNYQSVTILDAHSDVTPALLNQVKIISNHNFVTLALMYFQNRSDYILVSPDGGSLKKIYKLSQHLEGVPVIECSKKRDVKTGKLSGFTVYADDLEGRTCVVVDDICDGGGTFLGLAKKLKEKNCGELILMVTHGIFSKGLEKLSKSFDHIYTTNSFSTIENTAQFTQVNLKFETLN